MTLQHKNSTIAFTQKGKGDAIILLHGFLENQSMWQPFMETLAQSYHVITIDLLGHGKTAPIGYVHTMEQMVTAIEAVLIHLDIKKAHFAGHSMGGYAALAYAKMFPKKVLSLALINSTPVADSQERKDNRDRAIKAVKTHHKNAISMSIANLFTPENRLLLDDDIAVLKQEALNTPLQGIIAAQEGMKLRTDFTEFFKTIKYPKLIVLGKKDPVLNFDQTSKATHHKSILQHFFEDGHMSPMENKVELIEVLKRFYNKLNIR